MLRSGASLDLVAAVLPDETERQEVIHDLTDAERTALGGVENLVELSPETSEQLDWRPSTLFVTVHVRTLGRNSFRKAA